MKVLLDHLSEPLTIKIHRNGSIAKVTGEKELRERSNHLTQARIVRAKRAGLTVHRATVKTPA